MTILNTRRDLKQLKATCRQLMDRIELAQEGARYRRKKDRRKKLEREVKQAMSYIEFAIDALEGGGGFRCTESGWLRTTMSRLTHALMREVDPDDDEASENEVGSLPELLGDGDFQGSTKAISVPDLLHLLRSQVQTGVLQVDLPNEVVHIEFEEGDVVHAYSDNAPAETKLGEILVQRGAISRERFESFLFCYTPSLGLFGEALERGELVTEEDLQLALADQVQRLFNRLFAQSSADFWFRRGVPKVQDQRKRMDVISLLLESARMQDEANSPS